MSRHATQAEFMNRGRRISCQGEDCREMAIYSDEERSGPQSNQARLSEAAKPGWLRGLLIVLVVAAAVRAPCFLISCQDPSRQIDEDSPSYLRLGYEVADGHGFGRPVALKPGEPEQWLPELFRTPGYPAIIAAAQLLTGRAVLSVIALQNILGVAMCGGLYLVGCRHFGPGTGLVLGLLAATDLQAVALSNKLLTDFPFEFIVFAALALAGRLPDKPSLPLAAAAACLIGLAAWVRPTGIALPIVFGVCLLAAGLWRRNGRLAATALIVAVLGSGIVGAWIVRNGLVRGDYVLTSVARYNHVAYFGAHTLQHAEGISHQAARARLCDEIGLTEHEILYRPMSRQEKRRLGSTVHRVIAQHPGTFLWISAKDSANLYFGPDKSILSALGLPHISFGIVRQSSNTSSPWISWLLLGWETFWLFVVYAMVLRTLFQRLRRRRVPAVVWMGLLVALYILLVSSGPIGDPRMRGAAIPALLLVAAASLGSRTPGRDGQLCSIADSQDAQANAGAHSRPEPAADGTGSSL